MRGNQARVVFVAYPDLGARDGLLDALHGELVALNVLRLILAVVGPARAVGFGAQPPADPPGVVSAPRLEHVFGQRADPFPARAASRPPFRLWDCGKQMRDEAERPRPPSRKLGAAVGRQVLAALCSRFFEAGKEDAKRKAAQIT